MIEGVNSAIFALPQVAVATTTQTAMVVGAIARNIWENELFPALATEWQSRFLQEVIIAFYSRFFRTYVLQYLGD